MQIFARLTKVDVAKRQVTGILVQECLDRSGEIFDYETSKAHFQEWSDGISKATDGKSVGNLRSMHSNLVAGKFVGLTFEDAAKSIEVVAEVVDDNEWKKCESGCYTGFSIGGKYEKKWNDPADPTKKRYTAIPSEGSLVDMPCVPTAQFKMVKADGVEELHKFHIDNTPFAKSLLIEGVAEKSAPLLKALAAGLGIEVVTLDEPTVVKVLDAAAGDVPENIQDISKLIGSALVDLSKAEAPDPVVALTKSLEVANTSLAAVTDSLTKVTADLDLVKTDLAKVTAERDNATDELTKTKTALTAALAKTVPSKVAVKAVGKVDEINPVTGAVAPVEDVKKADGSIDHMATAMAQIRHASKNPLFQQGG